MNLVAALVRGVPVEDALAQLAVSPKRAAKTVSKVRKIPWISSAWTSFGVTLETPQGSSLSFKRAAELFQRSGRDLGFSGFGS